MLLPDQRKGGEIHIEREGIAEGKKVQPPMAEPRFIRLGKRLTLDYKERTCERCGGVIKIREPYYRETGLTGRRLVTRFYHWTCDDQDIVFH